MKKFLMLMLVLTLVFGFSSVMMAEDDMELSWGPKPNPSCTKNLEISAYVPFYASIDLPASLKLDFTDKTCLGDGQHPSQSVDLTVRTNGWAQLTGKLQPLTFTYGSGSNKEVNILPTTVWINQKQGNASFMTLVGASEGTKDLPSTNKSGKGKNEYTVKVQADLDLVEKYATGTYNGKLTITVAQK